MFFKKIKKTFILALLTFIIMPFSVLAYSDYLIPGGENIGIELNTNGVVIVGFYDINSKSPAIDSGLKIGDVITSVDEEPIKNIDDMVNVIGESTEVNIGYRRNNKTYSTSLKLYKTNNNIYKTGLYVKDTISGIGTLTFIDPNTKIFGTLGHEIVEKTTGKILDIKDGKIYSSTVIGIERSSNGSPGEKNARFDSSNTNGYIKENTKKGVFGIYTKQLPDKKLYKVANKSEIKKGPAKILTVIKDDKLNAYNINIIRINRNQATKNILFEIIDKNLLEETNGIVQGMSGSPIIQDNYIVGAVTHVIVDSPTKGYGILITNMLEEAEN